MITVKKRYSGQSVISTNSGDIRIETGAGRLVVYDRDTNNEVTVLDKEGFLFSDGNVRRIKLGSFASRVGLWVSKAGKDVIDLLGG
jgi:hypothetical protein